MIALRYARLTVTLADRQGACSEQVSFLPSLRTDYDESGNMPAWHPICPAQYTDAIIAFASRVLQRMHVSSPCLEESGRCRF